MKLPILVSTLCTLLSFNALADTTLLSCSTQADALASVDVIQKSDQSTVIRVVVSEADDAPATDYVVATGLKELKAKESAALVAQEAEAISGGGARYSAVLLNVAANRKSAQLAMSGAVYELSCY